MTLSEVHSTAQAAISNDAGLASGTSIIIEDGITNYSAEIDQALQDHGFCFAMGDVTGAQADTMTDTAHATLPFFIYENPNVYHEPKGLALAEAVISALKARHNFRLSQFGRFTNEKGGTLTICEFHAIIVFNE